MKEGIIKDTYEILIREIQTIITILYISMIGIGMLFSYKKYSRFEINIFEYADVFDFLVTPFQDFRKGNRIKIKLLSKTKVNLGNTNSSLL